MSHTRIYITGTLVLDGPAHFGNGDVSAATDMPLQRNGEGRLLLTGASVAGALRAWLASENPDDANLLFGHGPSSVNNNRQRQSLLYVDDALADKDATTEMRDQVALDPMTRTAADKKKFDLELIPHGTTFELGFELTLTNESDGLLPVLVEALAGLQQGQIGLGKRKSRGFGTCHVKSWTVRRYDLTTLEGVMRWLRRDTRNLASGNDIGALLGASTPTRRSVPFSIHATFALKGSLLIRADAASGADMGHLHSQRNGKSVPVLSGSSAAGAIRARALRIAQSVSPETGKDLVVRMFGGEYPDDVLHRSHVRVAETAITGGKTDLVQHRVRIDRFTGGAYPGALFNQQPLFGTDATRVSIELTIDRESEQLEAEAGLLLLVLKDLWTEDLALGGESSIGRGRLQGLEATIAMDNRQWRICEQGGTLAIEGDAEALEQFVRSFHGQLSHKEAHP
jgi:CRISPR/Cas system CSM-associated protein Csm3 (group 7 of RAMP superfamily)